MPRTGWTSYRQIAAQLRAEWLRCWTPGLRLPSYEQMQAELGTTRATLQRAMDLLADQGFIVRRPTVGAYLAARPPNETIVGLAFPGHPEQNIRSWQWTRHFLAIKQVADGINAEAPVPRIRFYMDVTSDRPEGLEAIAQDVRDACLAGLLMPFVPHDLDDSPLIRQQPLPMVFLNAQYPLAQLSIHYDKNGIISQAAALIAEAGCHRPAILTIPHRPPEEVLAGLSAVTGLEVPRHRLQAASPFHPRWLPNLLELLLQPDADGRPDVLVVTDDHLVEPVAAALVEMGIRLGDELQLIGHWNFPLVYRGPRPITLVGFDAESWVRQAIDLVQSVRVGETQPPCSIEIPLHIVRGNAPQAPVAISLSTPTPTRTKVSRHADIVAP